MLLTYLFARSPNLDGGEVHAKARTGNPDFLFWPGEDVQVVRRTRSQLPRVRGGDAIQVLRAEISEISEIQGILVFVFAVFYPYCSGGSMRSGFFAEISSVTPGSWSCAAA